LRPFLSISKKDILTCCQEHHWRYRNDSSNFENEYTRNKIRNLLIPLLHEVHPGSKRSILQLGQDCQEIQQYLTLQARDFLGTTQEFQKNDFIKLPTILQKEVLAELYNRANQ
jgi:tRNA(Ile)-lysidine synthase TilS/MesJ